MSRVVSLRPRHPAPVTVPARPAQAPHAAAADDERLTAWACLIEALPDATWLVDAARHRVVAANAASARLFGVRAEAAGAPGLLDLCAAPEDACFWDEAARGRADALLSDTFVRRADGSRLAVTRSARRIAADADTGGGGDIVVVAFHDRSGQLRAESGAEVLVAELRATLESTADALLVTDLDGAIRAHNRRFATLWGLSGEMLARHDDAAVLEAVRRAVVDRPSYDARLAEIGESPLAHFSDTLTLRSGRMVERVSTPQLSRGLPTGRVHSFRDITERMEAARRVEAASHTDALTGLPNRRLLADRIERALAVARRDASPLALMFLDLDRFKHINDSLGHLVGDRVLVEIAERIKGCLRQVDTVARLGGDEFVLLLHHADAAIAEATARRVLEATAQPFAHADLGFTVTCSIGIALYPDDGANVEELMRHADKAMYSVKDGGRAGFRFHRAHRDVDLRPRLRIDHAMRRALHGGLFRVGYQPQLAFGSGRLVGAEALVRWTDPELGEMRPADFLPIAEESGFIVAIGDWVLAQAVRQAAAWHAAGRSLCVAVNVSALQFAQPDFVAVVARALADSGLPARLLDLEVTEAVLIEDAAGALERLRALAALGVRLTIDDFGTGYSSLGQLKRFPIQRLKIDRSFVAGLSGDDGDAAIVEAIVSVGRALGFEIIAEGVETETQHRLLEAAGCDLYQGWLFAPALDAEAFAERVLALGG